MKIKMLTYLLSAFCILIASQAWAQKSIERAQLKNKKLEAVSLVFESVPSGARVSYNGEVICNSTPGTATIYVSKKTLPRHLIFTFEKSGYEKGMEVIDTKSGQLFKLSQSFLSINHRFETSEAEKKIYQDDTSIVAGEAHKVVNRDNAGSTALERTIIRWYFDSDPQGAQVYWRVISSVPAEVKNTNENYLGTTPYEETRSFNILGLTYENARDVQVEVKIKKKGYHDSVKRFNVRQAIDQQEISSFYELVKRDE